MKETDKSFETLQRRVHILEMMTETMKWMTEVSEENDKLRGDLGEHDLTRLQLMESEREREDLKLLSSSLRERVEMWQSMSLALAEVLFDLERGGHTFTDSQRQILADVLKESQSNE